MPAALDISTRKVILRFAAILIFISISAFNAHPQENKPQANKEPSLKETTDWLKESLNAYASFTETISGKSTMQKVDFVEFDGCMLSYTYTHKASSIGLEIKRKITFRLGDIDQSKVKMVELEAKPERYYLRLPALENKPSIKSEMSATFMGPLKDRSSWIAEANIPFDNFEITYRVSYAFIHAIKLCQANKQPF